MDEAQSGSAADHDTMGVRSYPRTMHVAVRRFDRCCLSSSGAASSVVFARGATMISDDKYDRNAAIAAGSYDRRSAGPYDRNPAANKEHAEADRRASRS